MTRRNRRNHRQATAAEMAPVEISQHFKPDRLPGVNRHDIALNAMNEQRELWRTKELILTDTLRDVYQKHNLQLAYRLSEIERSALSLGGTYGVYHIRLGWLLKPPNFQGGFPYEAVFDGNKIVRVLNKDYYSEIIEKGPNAWVNGFGKRMKKKEFELLAFCKTTDGLFYFLDKQKINETVLVCADLELLNDKRLFNAVKNVRISTFNPPVLSLVQGVPGCGKTTYILRQVKPYEVVLFATREGAEDFRIRFNENLEKLKGTWKPPEQQFPTDLSSDSDNSNINIKNSELFKHELHNSWNAFNDGIDRYVNTYFRTIDSYLIFAANAPKVTKIYIDEALIMHYGAIMYAVFVAQATEVELLGDMNQIPYINRMPMCDVRFSSVSQFSKVKKHLSVSYRCTNSTAVILSKYYPQGMQSVSRVSHEMNLIKITQAEEIEISKEAKVLVFKQADKKKLSKLGHDVSTIHEYQGKQSDLIVLVRLSLYRERLFDSLPHCIVAISRHKKSFTYYTPIVDDLIGKWVSRSCAMTTNELLKAQAPPANIPALSSNALLPAISKLSLDAENNTLRIVNTIVPKTQLPSSIVPDANRQPQASSIPPAVNAQSSNSLLPDLLNLLPTLHRPILSNTSRMGTAPTSPTSLNNLIVPKAQLSYSTVTAPPSCIVEDNVVGSLRDHILSSISGRVIPLPPPNVRNNLVVPQRDPILSSISGRVTEPPRPIVENNVEVPQRDSILSNISGRVTPLPPPNVQNNLVVPQRDPILTNISERVTEPPRPIVENNVEVPQRDSILSNISGRVTPLPPPNVQNNLVVPQRDSILRNISERVPAPPCPIAENNVVVSQRDPILSRTSGRVTAVPPPNVQNNLVVPQKAPILISTIGTVSSPQINRSIVVPTSDAVLDGTQLPLALISAPRDNAVPRIQPSFNVSPCTTQQPHRQMNVTGASPMSHTASHPEPTTVSLSTMLQRFFCCASS